MWICKLRSWLQCIKPKDVFCCFNFRFISRKKCLKIVTSSNFWIWSNFLFFNVDKRNLENINLKIYTWKILNCYAKVEHWRKFLNMQTWNESKINRKFLRKKFYKNVQHYFRNFLVNEKSRNRSFEPDVKKNYMSIDCARK